MAQQHLVNPRRGLPIANTGWPCSEHTGTRTCTHVHISTHAHAHAHTARTQAYPVGFRWMRMVTAVARACTGGVPHAMRECVSVIYRIACTDARTHACSPHLCSSWPPSCPLSAAAPEATLQARPLHACQRAQHTEPRAAHTAATHIERAPRRRGPAAGVCPRAGWLHRPTHRWRLPSPTARGACTWVFPRRRRPLHTAQLAGGSTSRHGTPTHTRHSVLVLVHGTCRRRQEARGMWRTRQSGMQRAAACLLCVCQPGPRRPAGCAGKSRRHHQRTQRHRRRQARNWRAGDGGRNWGDLDAKQGVMLSQERRCGSACV